MAVAQQTSERLTKLAESLSVAALLLDAPGIHETKTRICTACYDIGRAWSGGWLGYHARTYLEGFQAPKSGERFDIEWGRLGLSRTKGLWREYSSEEVRNEVLRRTDYVSKQPMLDASDAIKTVFESCKSEALAIIAAAHATYDDAELGVILEEIRGMPASNSPEFFAFHFAPKGAIGTRDTRASIEGINAPTHMSIEGEIMSCFSIAESAKALEKLLRRAATYLDIRMSPVRQTSSASSLGRTLPARSFWQYTNPLFLVWFLVFRLPWLAITHPSKWFLKVLLSIGFGAAAAFCIFSYIGSAVGAFQPTSDPKLNATILIGAVAAFIGATNLCFSIAKEIKAEK